MKKLYKSLGNSLRGLKEALFTEHSFKIEALAAFLVVLAMIYFPLSFVKEAVLSLAIVFVLSLELANSALERTLDLIQQEHHPGIRDIKDIMSAAVLVSALGALAAGVFVFWPYISWIFR